MNEFEYVLPAKKSEVDQFFKDTDSQRLRDYNKNLGLLNRMKDKIINEYHAIKSDYLKNQEEYQVKFLQFRSKVLKLNEAKKCICGADVRLVSGPHFGDFWGCTEHMNYAVRHENYILRPDALPNFYEPSVKGWPAQIRNRLGLSKSVSTGIIYNFILNNNLPDLSLHFEGVSELGSIYKIVDTRKKATAFELQQFKRLGFHYDKCVWQFSIKYKSLGVRGQKYAFPDIVCSDDRNVYIYECKTSKSDVNDYQKSLYIDLISKLLKDAGDTRNVVFEYLFEHA
ncbi:hypothetical protein [Pedobacter nyackensis]|uniref:Uncharacterized protein n=1 Tax=Pedobacter nyackensis TaxID=475255 RepID=A0A1W1ZVT8_9SPHI|nr:hypothetical protein [Pedobacter nyackensis]SMC52585.1 hypothetical protein SAMN04488101_10196 [Pedobacter nyackensis]